MLSCKTYVKSGWLALTIVTAAIGCIDDDPVENQDAAVAQASGGVQDDGSMPSKTGGHSDSGSGGVSAEDATVGDVDAAVVGPRWSTDIHPLLVASCGGCHGEPNNSDAGVVIGRPGLPGETTGDGPGKFAVDDAHVGYEAIRPFAIPGDAAHSMLYIKISEDSPTTGGDRMPPTLRQWDQASIDLVAAWIDAGAVEN